MSGMGNLIGYLGRAALPGEISDAVAGLRRRAVRVVAGQAGDADECRLLLDMLGLHPSEAAERPANKIEVSGQCGASRLDVAGAYSPASGQQPATSPGRAGTHRGPGRAQTRKVRRAD